MVVIHTRPGVTTHEVPEAEPVQVREVPTLSRRLEKLNDIRFRRLASDLTGRRTADCARVPVLIEQIDDRVASVSADGAYDAAAVYEAAMVKNAVYRYKTIIGRRMRSRTFAGQRVEVLLACKILNTMTQLGMPDSYRVA